MVADSDSCCRSSNKARTPRRVLSKRRALPIWRPSWPMKHASCVRLAISIPTLITSGTSPADSKLGAAPTSASSQLPCALKRGDATCHNLLIRGHSRSGAAVFPTKLRPSRSATQPQLRWSTTLPGRSAGQSEFTLQGASCPRGARGQGCWLYHQATSGSAVSSGRSDINERMHLWRAPAPSRLSGGPAGAPSRRAPLRQGVGGRQSTRERPLEWRRRLARPFGFRLPHTHDRDHARVATSCGAGDQSFANAQTWGAGPWRHQADRGSQAGSSSITASRSSFSRQGCRWGRTFC
jgi:hypothetical protein